ncbi:MAG: class I SAM-dependent methyltransferase [Woeseiaceae bacterium]
MSVKRHYDDLLGPVYSWVVGDFESASLRSEALFDKVALKPRSCGLAVDLGCGPGCQAIPLADRGFMVIAMDFCEELLGELGHRSAGRSIVTVCDDILNFADHVDEPPELVTCMGDTLVHLSDEDIVQDLVGRIASAIAPGGVFIATLRDYSGPPPTGAARFIPVRSDGDRIFTCFLDYRDGWIDVHDILQTRQDDGWTMQIGRYRKLLLDYRRVVEWLREAGLAVAAPFTDHGMQVVLATKAA